MRLFKPNVQNMENRKDVPGLIKTLTDKDGYVRRAAAEALGRIGDARAVEPLSAAFCGLIGDWGVTDAIKKALAKIGAPAVESLCTILKEHENSWKRKAAAEALGQIGDARAVKPLSAALRDRAEDVRKTAAEALEKVGLPDDPTVQVWYDMAKGMGEIRITSLGGLAVEPLCEALKHEDYHINTVAALALGQIGDVRAVESLGEALLKRGYLAIAEALACFGTLAIEPLCKALKHEGKDVHSAAVRGLIKIGAPATEPLREVLKAKDCYRDVYDAVVKELEKIDDAWAVEMLYEVFSKLRHEFWGMDGNRWKDGIIDRATKALLRICAPVYEAIKHKDLSVRWTTIRELVRIGAPTVEPLCVALLEDRDQNIRKAAAEALEQIGDARAVWALCEVLDSGYGRDDVRMAAARALVKIGAPAVEPLCETLKKIAVLDYNINKDYRKDAPRSGINDFYRWKITADALVEIGDERAVERLIDTLKGNTTNQRRSAAEVLVILYRKEKLDAKVKQKILAVQTIMAKPHCDFFIQDGHHDNGAIGIDIGEIADVRAVDELIGNLKDGYGVVRRGAANALIALYRSDKLDEKAKQKILSVKTIMAKPHNDSYIHIGNHTDMGIGVTL